uniref:Uncharacterized protein n=1 Tax=Aegilops tauschii subsp. strangulata TaxID=200361 RepID=A0A453PJE6_AEGTS
QKDFSTNKQLIKEVKDLPSSFQEFRVAWMRRLKNKVALVLTRKCCIRSLCKIWLHVSSKWVSLEIATEEAMNFE